MIGTTRMKLMAAAITSTLLLGCAAAQLHRQGITDVERGDYEAGVAELGAAVEKDPDNLSYRLDLAARREAALQKLVAEGDAERNAGHWDGAAHG